MIMTKINIFEANATGVDKVFTVINYVVLSLLGIVTLYPILYVVSSSFSSTEAVAAGQVFLLPVDFSLDGYKAVFEYKDIWLGYGNTIFYTVVGTIVNVILSLLLAYPLSRKDLFGCKKITFLLTLTMLFNAGLIPTYLLMSDLHLINTRFVVILLGLLTVRNIILARSFYQSSIGNDLIEAAKIDGATEWQVFGMIIIPLSKPIIAVLALFTMVEYWNEFFTSMIYLNDKGKYPLQLFLREILVMNNIDPSVMAVDMETMEAMYGLHELLKYSVIVVASLPIMMIYPFIQKFFVRGVMDGAIKG